jgi:hypothetical protein
MNREGLGSRRTAVTAGCRMPYAVAEEEGVGNCRCSVRGFVPDFQ